MDTLDYIGLAYGTDKASDGHDYLSFYEEIWPDLKSGCLLELGWYDGASINMWRDWLPGWDVVGLDIEEKEPIEGTIFVKGDQADPRLARQVGSDLGPFNVIIDDASHLSPLTIASFQNYWPHLQAGGVYIVEDLHVSYHKSWQGNPNPERPGSGGQTIMQFIRMLTDNVHLRHAGAGPDPQYTPQHKDIARIELRPGVAAIWKKG